MPAVLLYIIILQYCNAEECYHASFLTIHVTIDVTIPINKIGDCGYVAHTDGSYSVGDDIILLIHSCSKSIHFVISIMP